MPTNLDVAAGLLRKYKIQVDCLGSGQEAVERIRSGSQVYNAIFMDHMMPGLDGIETTEAIRALGTEYARKIPVIALTANAIHGTEEIFYEHGFQAFISKPIDVMQLDTVIRKWVRDESWEDAHSPPGAAGDSDANEIFIPSKHEEISINIPGVDSEKGLLLYEGEMDIYLPLLRSYALNTPEGLDKIRAVSRETLPDYTIMVHGLKGTSASIGAEKTREAAFNLEKMAKSGDYDGVMSLNEKFIRDTENLVANIKAWLEEYDVN
jgi:CheY-like chemotaxis protein